jgi:hypothetical protein
MLTEEKLDDIGARLEYKLCGFSRQANYTDRATATCRRS